MPETIRRSGRSRKSNARYTNDGWNKETLQLLRGSSESSDDHADLIERGGSRGDEDFTQDGAQAAASPTSGKDEDNSSVTSGSGHSSEAVTPGEEDEDDDVDEDGLGEVERVGRRGRMKIPKSDTLHSRGIGAVERGTSARGGIWQSVFGPNVEDLKPVLLSKDRWLYNVRDVTLPSWKTLAEARSDERIKTHGTTTPSARGQGIPSETTLQQTLRRISLEEARERFYLVDRSEHTIVLGPWNRQQAYNLPHVEPVSLGQAWRKDVGPDGSYYTGWVVNAGEKPQCLAWSRNQDREQYLAIACRSTPLQRKTVAEPQSSTSPAYRPSALYPVGIQIWKVAVTEQSNQKTSMDLATAPQLLQILACNFGDVKQMAWAPEGVFEDNRSSFLGMLTLLTTDGRAHLVRVPKSSSSELECLKIVSSAITIDRPTDNVFSCFTFASSTDLVLGTSSGHVHIYNLSQPVSMDRKLDPYLVSQLHSTYILSICTLDDEYSHFLASTSASGALQLTDLRSPVQDVVAVPRARIPSRNLICNLDTRAFITTIDSSGNTEPRGNAQTTIVAHNLRHFYSSMALAKSPEGSGTATALAGSPLHPIILMGNSGGNIWAQNVVRRVMPTAKPGGKNDGGSWTQKVVEYEWIPQKPATQQSDANKAWPRAKSTSERDKVDLHHGQAVRPGISRMHYGFKPEKLDLSNIGSKKRKSAASGPNGESAVQVIFEEEQAVTAIEWNPNSIASSWSAIGWGSGVVLITDLGHDTD